MDDETAQAILDVRADTVALRGVVKMLLRRTYGIGDDALAIIRDDALASVETAIEGEPSVRQRYFHQAVRRRSPTF